MRILINGWFHDQLATGSGQYLTALEERLPRLTSEHEWLLVRQGHRSVGEQREAESTSPPRPSAQNAPGTVRTIHAQTPFDSLNGNLAKLWFEQVTFPWVCHRLHADVAFIPYWAPPAWSPCPVVVTIHDLIPLLQPLYRGGLLQRSYTALVGATARRAAAILTDSVASQRDIARLLHIPDDRIHVVYLAADARFQPVVDPSEQARVRRKYRLPDRPYFLYMGGFDVRKNVVRTIEAYARLVQAGDARGTQLVIAGKLPQAGTPFAPDPKRAAHASGVEDQVHFTGWVDEADKPALYSMALCTLFVSEYEGFGLPVLEATACDSLFENRGTI